VAAGSDEHLMCQALALAQRGLDEGEMPVGAVVSLGEEVVGSGYWQYSPAGLLDHAEIVALRAAEKDPRIQGRRREASLYTTLEPCCSAWEVRCPSASAGSCSRSRLHDGASTVTKQWQPMLGFPPPGYQVFSTPEVRGGVCRDGSLDLMRSYVERHPDTAWLGAMLPGFAYPDDAAP
jgi:tRNA(adenine34) deaminase